jgi:hypothetical protein
VLEALLEHRAFWAQPPSAGGVTDDHREHAHGVLALGPLGLACLAHDRGIPIEVESPYIPKWIVRRAVSEPSMPNKVILLRKRRVGPMMTHPGGVRR